MAEDDATSDSVDHDDDDNGDVAGDVAQMRDGDGGDRGDGGDGTRPCDVPRTCSLVQVWDWRLLSVSISRTVMSPPPQNHP